MAIDPNSAQGQVQTIYGNFSTYFSDMSNYLINGGACPDFNTYITNMDYSEIYRTTTGLATKSSSYFNGSAIESIHHVTGVLREFAMRTKTKTAYYSDASSDAGTESDYYSTLQTVHTSSLGGVPPVGGSL